MSRVGFFIVLLSCELSITSYCMVGLPGLVLWKAAVGDFAATVHCLLAAAPLAYIIAICSHWYSASQSASDSTPDRKSRLSRLLPTSETKMELEHVVPGMRLHLAVKSISADDVDAMFKIHRLIFVAFGVGQALALLMLHFQSGTYKRADGTEGVVQALTWKMWKLEWIVVGTFGLALLIELAATLSPLIKHLHQSIKMEGITYNSKKLFMYERVKWLAMTYKTSRESIDRWAEDNTALPCNRSTAGTSNPTSYQRSVVKEDEAVRSYRANLKKEVEFLAGTINVPADVLDLEMIDHFRRELFRSRVI
jgi:hypothetical protein